MNVRYGYPGLCIMLCLALACCGPNPSKAPVTQTPAGAKIDLNQVGLEIISPRITGNVESGYSLRFDYTVDNHSGAHIVFPCLYNHTDELIEVNLSDRDGVPLLLAKRPLEGLTLAEPRPLKIPIGKTTRSYRVPVLPEQRKQGDLIHMRVRLHAPSRYDELRSSIEAPAHEVPWP